MSPRIPAPRKGGKPQCPHSRTTREGPYTVPMPKGPHKYYQVKCVDCGKWIRNEDA